ncbi:PDZ domain-containing protein [Gloeocapsopsis crepidinum LEGE 06123]|uniref:PDZ domain-containing protein n=1 Tax=Gloeocapsopsis crepidinum LEGE 06123 TaxID=588587 RepID=A0ABR9ULA5_9CHRO|nr:S41 family peptidase [Gloeocapsopsis crepidinum]MBE9189066.1 PDZ domain-containing protein [Gloeocapsopsis crepidinum LEGE 06123]
MQQLNLTRHIRLIAIALMSAFILFLCGAIAPILPTVGQSQPDTFEQVWKTVNDNFFDPNFNGINWQEIHEKYRTQANQARSKAELARIINQMLSELRTSHTHFYTSEEPEYYQILGIFLPRNPELQQQLKTVLPDNKPQYTGIGIFTKQWNGNTFISAILDGSPASKAGLLVGDQLLRVEGQPFHPIQSFAGKANQPVKLLIQRSPIPSSQQEITVTPKILDGTTMFLDAMKASVQVVEQARQKIGYVHLWSYAGEQYQKQLETELFYGRLKDTDTFVLDLREGWGGARASYLNIYTPRNIRLTGTARNRTTPSTSSSAWSKPVVMLVNEESRSGKEILAYGFRKYEIGTVVGAKTAGAVVQGNLFAMNDGSVLYLAIADVYLDENQRIERVGVKPDIEVPFSLDYARGSDPQKERAIAVALEAVNRW